MGALEGLSGIIKIEADLERDAFTLTCDPQLFNRQQVAEAIQELGFTVLFQVPGSEAAMAVAGSPGQSVQGTEEAARAGAVGSPPEPIAGALAEARQSGQHVFIDFTAEWCAPCKVIEGVVLPDERVQRALQGYVFVRVDTDENPAAVAWYGVSAMPTLLILDQEGGEITRLVGPVTAIDLAAALERGQSEE